MINEVKYLIIHCSATQPKSDIGAKEIDRMHRERGFLKIGYHFVIRRSGVIELGRKFPDEIGAHTEGFNKVSCGICMVGGIDSKGRAENNFTIDQWAALGELVALLHDKFPDAAIVGHRDMPNVHKDCPCFDVKSWFKDTVENTTRNNPIIRAGIPAVLKDQSWLK